jgi:hypothetical protein
MAYTIIIREREKIKTGTRGLMYDIVADNKYQFRSIEGSTPRMREPTIVSRSHGRNLTAFVRDPTLPHQTCTPHPSHSFASITKTRSELLHCRVDARHLVIWSTCAHLFHATISLLICHEPRNQPSVAVKSSSCETDESKPTLTTYSTVCTVTLPFATRIYQQIATRVTSI